MWSTSFLILVFNFIKYFIIFCVVQFSRSVMSYCFQPHGLQYARLPCPSPTPRAYSNSCPLSQWCHPTISSSVVPFSSRLQSFPASGSFQISQFFTLGGQSIRASALVFSISLTDFLYDWLVWFPCSSRDSQESFPTPRVLENIFPSFFFFFDVAIN